jgi:hypothetical protein
MTRVDAAPLERFLFFPSAIGCGFVWLHFEVIALVSRWFFLLLLETSIVSLHLTQKKNSPIESSSTSLQSWYDSWWCLLSSDVSYSVLFAFISSVRPQHFQNVAWCRTFVEPKNTGLLLTRWDSWRWCNNILSRLENCLFSQVMRGHE